MIQDISVVTRVSECVPNALSDYLIVVVGIVMFLFFK